MKKSMLYILVFLLGVGIGTLKAQENVQSEIKNDQSLANELLPGEIPESDKEIIGVSARNDTRMTDEQIEIIKKETSVPENQKTLLPGEHTIFGNTNKAVTEDPKRDELNFTAKDEIINSGEEVTILPGEYQVSEVTNSEIVQEETRSPEEQNTSVPSEQDIPSLNDQPEGDKSGQVINYRTIKGTETQPEPEKSGTVINYRNNSGPDTQPEGEKPDDN